MLRWAVVAVAVALFGCDGGGGDAPTTTAEPEQADDGAADPASRAARDALDREFPRHGLVTGVQLRIRAEPDPEAKVLGWLRIGSRIRADRELVKTSTCATGWIHLAPDGWACAGKGIQLSDTEVEGARGAAPPDRQAGLPYAYYFVKEHKVPEYHRLPSREEQRAAQAFVARYLELYAENETRAQRFLRGELPNQPKAPAVVRRFLDRGFFVAGAGVEERKGRRFVLTVRGAYVQQSQLEARTGSEFQGVTLDDERTLPVAWAVRTAQPFREFQGVTLDDERTLPVAWAVRTAQPFHVTARDDGSLRMVADPQAAPYERHAIVPWAAHERIGDRVLNRLSTGHYLKFWFVAVARRTGRPRGVGADEPWVHINLEQQTMVLYRGDRPVYATLVSSGLAGHDTPIGLFEVRVKQVSDSMSDIGPEVGEDERYSIEDVPWTQYFEGSIALHGAFWHDRFGLRRSHGCVNLSPMDARVAFEHTWPSLTDGWHGVSAAHTGQAASKIWITEK